MKFGFDWPKRFQRRRCLNIVDGLRRRTPEHGYTIKLTYKPLAQVS